MLLLVNLFQPLLLHYLIYIISVSITVADEINISKFPAEKISEEGFTVLNEDESKNNKAILKKCPHVDPYLE